MDPAEVEFLAEKETITIIPNFSQDKIYLIGVSNWIWSFLLSDKRLVIVGGGGGTIALDHHAHRVFRIFSKGECRI